MIDLVFVFGLGYYESIFMCLELFFNFDLKCKNVLDVGCGSGILSIVLKK